MHNNNEYDLIVVGSGAGAMTAAITAADQGLSVLMVEKAAQYGGTSALSGGGIWIPNNHYFKAIGGKDSEELAWTYLKAAVGDRVDERRLRTYLHKSPEMIAWLEANAIPYRVILTNCDKLSRQQISQQVQIMTRLLDLEEDVNLIAFSALNRTGLSELRDLVASVVGETAQTVD